MARPRRDRSAARRAPVLVVAVALAAGAVGGCACGRGDGARDATGDRAVGSTPTDAGAASGSSTTDLRLTDPPVPPAGAGPGGPTEESGPCAAGNLAVRVHDGDSAAGHQYRRIVFANAGSRACTLSGFPAVTFLDAGGGLLPVVVHREPVPAGPVTLAPGSAAAVVVDQRSAEPYRGPDGSGEGCGRTVDAAAMRVVPPGSDEAATVPVQASLCAGDAGQVTVGPVVADVDSQP